MPIPDLSVIFIQFIVCFVGSMLIRNIKLSVKIPACPLDIAITQLINKKVAFKFFGNFITFTKKFSFVIFRPSADDTSHVNVTRVPKFGRPIVKSLTTLSKLLNCKILEHSVDNIIATEDLNKTLNLKSLAEKNDGHVIYNSERFPGLFMKFKHGTCILYHSGKIVIVGCRTVRGVKKIKAWLTANI